VSQDNPLPQSTGIVGSLITGFQARLRGRAYREIAGDFRAQAEALDANTQRHESALKLRRTIHKLEELPDILADDRAEREASRKASDEGRSEEQVERAHRRDLAAKRRKQEQIEADRGVFNADQGLGKLQSVRTFKEELWSADAYSKRTEATIRAAGISCR